ncbi:unnamed protein product, partial [Ectocarpus sp. 12 AP-2014]
STITEEVFKLKGNKYNPYWGYQNGKIRNSRERHIREPLFLLNYHHESEKFRLNAGLAYQTGQYTKSRLGYFNAPNPDPTYYRYLPSFYLNSPIGANFESAIEAKNGFLSQPQLDWEKLYAANTSIGQNGEAAYVLYDDVTKDDQLTARMTSNVELNAHFKLDMGLTYRSLNSRNYAQIFDLLGAEYHNDIDVFSETKNDLSSALNKNNGDIFNYNYNVKG